MPCTLRLGYLHVPVECLRLYGTYVHVSHWLARRIKGATSGRVHRQVPNDVHGPGSSTLPITGKFKIHNKSSVVRPLTTIRVAT